MRCIRALAALPALLAAAVSAYRPGDQVCTISPDNACPVDKLTPSETDRSTLVYPGGKTRCAFDDWQLPVSTNYSTNSTFFFQVFPNEKQDKRKLLIYLQGGGACVDDQTCDFALQCSIPTSTFQANARALSVGILNRTDPDNYFKDWNVVHIPYCTGDIHIGNRADCQKQNQSMHLNGFNNADSAFKWAAANFPNPEHLVLSGSSAGGLAAQILAKHVADMWKLDTKKTRYSVIADSYVGVVPEDKPAGYIVNYYGGCNTDYKLGAKAGDLASKCKSEKLKTVEFVSTVIEETPSADWLFVDSKGDITQRFFYELLRQGVISFPFKEVISKENFFANMTAILDAYKKESKRVTTFFVEGEQHVFLNKPTWHQTPRVETNETLGAVVQEVLSSTVSGSGSGSGAARGVVSPDAPKGSSASATLSVTALSLVVSYVALISC
ncbi:hypothetical protein P43SY_009737 [Pythium insidiosum]|uniref:Pectin acetylesterase n=1 Tax=Pythium insidiosum TaxID=114742 RepID=A0AAD5LA35_PYTIN|nr:hypothetical protein P43SY_009737 [Pythium insidiosum]